MRILFDHGTHAPIRSFLGGRTIKRTQEMGWDRLTNGELLTAAEEAGFDLLLTTDKNIRYQQDLTRRKVAVVVISNAQWPVLRLHVERVVAAVIGATAGSYTEVEIPVREAPPAYFFGTTRGGRPRRPSSRRGPHAMQIANRSCPMTSQRQLETGRNTP